MKKTILLLLLFIGNLSFSQCVHRLPDLLIWENDTIPIQSFPLEDYSKVNIIKLFSEKGIKTNGWAQTKNYQAEWKIIENKLYLSNIYSLNYKKDNYKADLNDLFPAKSKKGLIQANWYSNTLFAPKGKHIWLGVSPGCKIFESEWEIYISKGVILNKELKKENYYQSIYTKNPDSLRIFINKHIDWNRIPVLENEKEKVYASIITGKNKNDFTISVKSKNEKLSQEVTRVLQILPEFDYYYRHGEFFKMGYAIPITFNENMRPK